MPARVLRALSVVALLVLAARPSAGAPPAQGIIRGVVFSVEGKPVAGATVKAGPATATTDKNGLFSLKVKPGTYDLVATHPRYTSDTQKGISVSAGNAKDVSAVLAPK